ncbi:activator of basal transcription 1-like [Cloeon dipterum]|uniref:activator of basal transcription 1-like n=1 Tax=Cloeon dipterum TaxID=197152 RepID=UPI00321FB91E
MSSEEDVGMEAEESAEHYSDDELLELDDEEETVEKKKTKTGILYLPNIPPYMNATILREMLTPFGEIGRIFLQKDAKAGARFKKVRRYSEGWVEFKSKRKAKECLAMLNNQKMSDRKKSKFYDQLWSFKYLPRFKWAHLSERLAYERAVHRQRVRTEVSQAKKEASHFQLSLDKSEKIRHMQKKQMLENVKQKEGFEIPQRKLDSEHKKKKNKKSNKSAERTEVISSLFG